jgi:hypothetical protein
VLLSGWKRRCSSSADVDGPETTPPALRLRLVLAPADAHDSRRYGSGRAAARIGASRERDPATLAESSLDQHVDVPVVFHALPAARQERLLTLIERVAERSFVEDPLVDRADAAPG